MGANWLKGSDGKPKRWTGGRIRLDRNGRKIWVLERQHENRPYAIRLEVRNEEDALAELALFERDPEAYETASEQRLHEERERRVAEANIVRLDDATIGSYLAYLRGVRLDENGQPVIKKDKEGKPMMGADGKPIEVPDPTNHVRTPHFRKTAHTYLTKWTGFYAGRDVRVVELQEIQRQLAKWGTNRKDRIVVLKSFMSFLREQRFLFRSKEDPTLDLKVPSSRPAKGKRAKLGGRKFYELKHVAEVYGKISAVKGGEEATAQAVRDVYRLLASYGMHFTEVERLAKGEGNIRVLKDQGEIAGTVTFVHKSARVHVVSMEALGLAAAQRLQARGAAPVYSYCRKLVETAAGKKELDLGTLRHSYATGAKNHGRPVKATDGGVPLTAVAAVLGHQSTQTTSRFYDGTEIPDMVVVPLVLDHPLDPLPLHRGGAAKAG